MRWFHRHPRLAVGAVVAASFIGILAAGELVLARWMGLGNPVLYRSSPVFGYRPLPNQQCVRFGGAVLAFNNLALRAASDWDDDVENKVLFLGDSVTYGGSYIANDELFSHLAVEGHRGSEAGNAGVNAWGIGNIYGLIVDCGFLPARIYVSVLPETDFYRGVSRLGGSPFWTRKPSLALEELFVFLFYKVVMTIYRGHDLLVPESEQEKAVERSVAQLAGMDEFLRSRGFVHLMYVSPERDQVAGDKPVDDLVLKSLEQGNLPVPYIRDRLDSLDLTPEAMRELFHDDVHLTKAGHKVWAAIIREDLAKVWQNQ